MKRFEKLHGIVTFCVKYFVTSFIKLITRLRLGLTYLRFYKFKRNI